MPSRPPTLSRRRVLVGAAALAALGVTVAGCGDQPPPPDLDDLTTALDRARSDSRLADDVAATTRGRLADALTGIAAQRSAHAEALAEEIVRMTGRAAPTTSVSTATTTTTASVPAPTAEDVIGALRTSADSATNAAGALSGYRAGLLASIAAACTAAYTVTLAGAGGSR
ncbi:hypothetical protein [Mycolicibacterium austroafricanum]|uniref:hypothetical protein n=1 Tax=Mycolicibacterium austroafricanum TaxID=39687 RepID=UPI001F1A9894|nr:hypothetical protein [Mycolicibacterium austroafricanum]